MKLLKLLLALVALVFVVWGAFWVFGILVGLFKWLVIFSVIALAGVGAYKLLAGPDEGSRPELTSAEAEMLKAERMLAEIRRKQLSK